MQKITSNSNEKVKELVRLLSSRKARRDKGLFVVEGARLALDYALSGFIPQEIYLTKEAAATYEDILSKLLPQTENIYEITQSISEKISDTKSPQGIYAVCKIAENNWNSNGNSSGEILNNGNYIILCSLQDPGNIGTIIRSCGAFGIDGIIMTEDCPDIYSPKVIRSTMGGIAKTNIISVKDLATAKTLLQNKGITLYGAVLSPIATNINETNFPKGVCFAIGNEGRGLSKEEVNLLDHQVIIPMAEGSESLNASVAASIIAWELYRRR